MSQPTGKVGLIEGRGGYQLTLAKRFEAMGWSWVSLSGREPAEKLLPLKLNAIVVDSTGLGERVADFVQELAEAAPSLAILVCGERSTVEERVRLLRSGADHWMQLPAHPDELVARIEAILRRTIPPAPRLESGPIMAGEVTLRPEQYQALVEGQSLGLTRREFEVLWVLAEARGEVIERELLYRLVWGYAMAHGDRSVDVFVRKIRQKLERHSPEWQYIHTHVGIGYRFDPEPAGSQTFHGAATPG